MSTEFQLEPSPTGEYMAYSPPTGASNIIPQPPQAVGVPGHMADRCLNQKLKGIEGVYGRHDYFEERKEALAKVAELVEPAINEGPKAGFEGSALRIEHQRRCT